MSVVDKTDKSRPGTIAFEIELAHAPEKVWRALTEPALLSEWLLPTLGMQLQPGATFTLKTQPFPEWDGTVRCTFLEIEPLRKLSYTWSVPSLDLVVTFTLTPTPSGTHLAIVQSGFAPEQTREAGGARYGWMMMCEQLVALLDKT
ncbi:MAG: SRPBCC domain-containing protein [Kofleriaceae bacterium]|nr:SRPBCC domain-containing protein [Kofleriaceae bacterium]